MDKKEIEQYMAEVIGECRSQRIPVSDHIAPEVQINRRAKSRFACCKRKKLSQKTIFLIEIGEALLQADTKVIKEILAHEILHTCYGCYDHGDRWKQYAQRMNNAYGYNIRTVTTYENLGLKKPEINRKPKYMIICEKCGMRFYRQKKSKVVTYTKNYRCRCGGKLSCMNIMEQEKCE